MVDLFNSPPDVFALITAILIPFLVITFTAVVLLKDDIYHRIVLPEEPYETNKTDDIEGYNKSDLSMEWFIASLRDSDIWYDPVLNIYGPTDVKTGNYLGGYRCPRVIARAAYVALTPIYHDQSQPLARREAAKSLMTRIYRWGYFTDRKITNRINLTHQEQVGRLGP